MLVFHYEYLWEKKDKLIHTHTTYSIALTLMLKQRWGDKSDAELSAVIKLYVKVKQGMILKYLFCCIVLTHFHAIWNALRTFTHYLLAYQTAWRAWCMSTCWETLSFFSWCFHATVSLSRKQQWKQNGDQQLIQYSKIFSVKKKRKRKARFVCFCYRFLLRWHISRMWLDVWHITL